MALVAAFARAAFLAEEAVIRPRLGEFGAHDVLGAMVGSGNEIARPLHRDLQMLDLAEVALKAAAGVVRGLDHDVDDRGVEHGASRSLQRVRVQASIHRVAGKTTARPSATAVSAPAAPP